MTVPSQLGAQTSPESPVGKWEGYDRFGQPLVIESAEITASGGSLKVAANRVGSFGASSFQLVRGQDGDFTFAGGQAKGFLSAEVTSGGLAGNVTWEGGPFAGVPFFLRRLGSGTPTQKPPVIVIPGVCGTELYSESGIEFWPFCPLAENRIRLKFTENGKQIWNIEIGKLLKGPFKKLDVYGELVRYLGEEGWVPGKTLFEFPYDWRQDNRDQIPLLDALIDQARRASGQDKVVLVAHSMGGIISRVYVLSGSKYSAKVDRIITMGTPYGGAPKVFYGLANGYNFDNPTANAKMMKILCQTFPAAYQLLPSSPFIYDGQNSRMLTLEQTHRFKYRSTRYFPLSVPTGERVRGTPIPVFSQYPESDAPEWTPHPELARDAREFYQRYGPAAGNGGVPTYTIIGEGSATLSGYYMLDFASVESQYPDDSWIAGKPRYVESHDGRKVVLGPRFGDGDGTVPLERAILPSATAAYFIPNLHNDPRLERLPNASHGALPNNPYAHQILGAILKGSPPAPNQWPRNSEASDVLIDFHLADMRDTWYGSGTAASFILRSDAVLTVRDASGRMLGYDEDGRTHEEIPGGTFLHSDGVECAVVNRLDQPYSLTVSGIRDGRFSLVVQVLQKGETCASFVYRDVPVAPGAVAEVTIQPDRLSGEPPRLSMGGEELTASSQEPCECAADRRVSQRRGLIADAWSVSPNDEVRVPIHLNTDQPLANMNFTVDYDPRVVSLVEDPVQGNLLGEALFSSNSAEPGIARLAFAQTQGLSGRGTVGQLRFRARGSVGSRTPLTLTVSRANSADGAVRPVATHHGMIRIIGAEDRLPGDGDGDGRLTALDALIALKMSVKLLPQRSDFNLDDDDVVTSRDAAIILQQALGFTVSP